MASLLGVRHYSYMFFVVLFFLFAIFTRKTIWMYHAVFAIFFFIGLITDLLFADYQFVFDPEYNNWKRKTELQE